MNLRPLPCLLALPLMLACRQPIPQPRPTGLTLDTEAADLLNPGPSGEALSLVLLVLQLREPASFQHLTSDQAFSGALEGMLSTNDLLGSREVVVLPGQASTLRLDLHPQCRYLGLVGLYRQPDPEGWRALVPLSPSQGKPTDTRPRVVLQVGPHQLRLLGTPALLEARR